MNRLSFWVVSLWASTLPLWAQPPQQWADKALKCEAAGQLQEAEQAWLQAIEGFQQSKETGALGRAYFYLGRLCFQQHKLEPARGWLEKAQQSFEQMSEWKGVALASLQLGLLDKEQERYPEAEEHLRTALQAARKGQDEAREFEVLGQLASLYDIAHRWSEAEDAYKRLSDYQRRTQSAELADTLVTLAAVYQVQSEGGKAQSCYRQAHKLLVEQGRTRDAQDALSRLARMLVTVGRFAEAEKVYTELLQGDPTQLVARANRAYCLEQMGQEKEALQEYEILLKSNPSEENRQALESQRIRLLYRTGQKELAFQLIEARPTANQRAHLLQELGESQRATQELESALAQTSDREESISLTNELAVLYLRLQQHDQAAQTLQSALQRFPDMSAVQKAGLLTNLAETHLDRDDYEPAIGLLEEAIPLWKQGGKSQSLMTALNNLAAAYQSQGHWDQALALLSQAQQVGDAFNKPASIQGTVANTLGLLYVKLGRYQEGMSLYQKALSLRRLLKDPRGEMITLANMGTAELVQKHPQQAKRYFEEAAVFCNKLQDKRMEATLCNNMAQAFPDDPDSQHLLERTLQLTSTENQPYDRGVALANLARRLAAQGKLPQARVYADEALALFEKLGARDDHFLLLDFYLQHRMPVVGPEPAEVAETMLNLLEELLRGLPSRLARAYVEEKRSALADVVEWAYRKHQAQGLLETEERVRALGVLALTRSLPNAYANLPEALRQKLTSLEQRLAETLRQNRSSNAVELKREYGLACEEAEGLNLAAGALHKARSATVAELQASLGPDEMMVEFVDLPQRRVAVLVEKEHLQVVEIGQLKEFRRLPRTLKYSDTPAVLEVWGKSLWAPWSRSVAAHINHLIVVPTGPLYRVPFAAITLDGKPLIERYQVDCATSATAWLVSRRSPTQGQGALLAALGNVQVSRDMVPLPGTLLEIHSLQTLWPQALTLSEKAMTRAALQKDSVGRRVLHFATHGILDPTEPLLGGLVASDGMVTVGDIFHWHLEAELAVLSACNTGQFGQGEEYVGLSRAFQCAGARTLLVTLWSISDDATATWMQLLHAGLRRGLTLDQAYQSATLELRKSHPQPYLWAPFVIWGDGQIKV